MPEHIDLREVFCFEKTRMVSNDWTVRCKSRFNQILRRTAQIPQEHGSSASCAKEEEQIHSAATGINPVTKCRI